MNEGWLFVRRHHEAWNFGIDWSIHGLSILCSETRHGVSAMVTTPWRVLDFKVELQETKAPTGESPLRIGEVQYPTEGMVIRTDDELLAFQVRPQLKNFPDDCQTLLLRGGVIPFRACQTSTQVPDLTSISFRLVLEQTTSDLVLGSIRVEGELPFRPRERQDGCKNFSRRELNATSCSALRGPSCGLSPLRSRLFNGPAILANPGTNRR
jgi:hypothetical protein